MIHHESKFKGYGEYSIYYQYWRPDSPVRAVLLIAHGFAEHSGRYQNIVNYFVPKGYAVYALDHRGHGRSDGERVHIDDFHHYIIDLRTMFDLVRNTNPNEKIFLIGHSMGSIISLLYAIEYQKDLDGLITSGGGIAKPGDQPLPIPPDGKPLPTAILSRDPEVIKAYENDPLVYHGPVPRDFAMFKARERLYEKVPGIVLPVLIMAGAGGVDGARSQVLYDYIGSEDKTLKLYEHLLHEIFNEPEHLRVMADLETWLDSH